MCERFVQSLSKHEYVRAIGWQIPGLQDSAADRIPHWNVPPGSQPWLMHRFGLGHAQIGMVNWGYRPAWATRIDGPSATGIALEQACHGPYFKLMFRNGRAVVPVDGWYEWSRTSSGRQPWFIRQVSRAPMFLAAICNYRPRTTLIDDAGFVLVCDDTPGSIIDRHGLRPIIFTAAEARIWLDNSVSVDSAQSLARGRADQRDLLEWHAVSTAVDRRGTNGSHLIQPLQESRISA